MLTSVFLSTGLLPQAVWEAYPDDPDACAFLALGLMATANSAVPYLSATEQGAAVQAARDLLGPCAARWPGHAGLLHYTVHVSAWVRAARAVGGVRWGCGVPRVCCVWWACCMCCYKGHCPKQQHPLTSSLTSHDLTIRITCTKGSMSLAGGGRYGIPWFIAFGTRKCMHHHCAGPS